MSIPIRLGTQARGYCGQILRIDATGLAIPLPAEELERRLLEMGFVEDAHVEIRHQGLIGRDPIAVRVNGITVGLRRREAQAIIVGTEAAATGA